MAFPLGTGPVSLDRDWLHRVWTSGILTCHFVIILKEESLQGCRINLYSSSALSVRTLAWVEGLLNTAVRTLGSHWP